MVPDAEHPFFFGPEAALFGVLHCPPKGVARGPGWVFCGAFGVERNNSQRLMVEWARELCRRGHPVLRFDYRGTGDSAGAFDELGVQDHVADALAAIRELRRWTGRSCGGLLGLRLGASLAAMAAARAGRVERLVLWEPVLDGRAYREQLLRVALANQLVHGGGRRDTRQELRERLAAGGRVHVDGFPLARRMYESLATVTPEELGRSPVKAALVVQIDALPGRAARRELAELAATLGPEGRTRLALAAAPIAWLRTRQFRWRPPELFTRTLEWIEEASGAEPMPFALPAEEPEAVAAVRATPHGCVVERPVSFTAEGQRLWGILHSPADGAAGAGRPPVVMLAAGETCRSAVFYPWLARRLAAAGWPTLRFDPRGLGDSRGEIDCRSVNEVFVQIEQGRLLPDALSAVDFATAGTGAASCILTGLCGGAVTAAYAAAADRRVAAIAPLELRLLWDRVSGATELQEGLGQLPWWERLSVRRGVLVLLTARRALHWLRARTRALRLAAARLQRRGAPEPPGRDGWFVERLGEDANLRVIAAVRAVLARGLPSLCLFAEGPHRELFESVLPGLLPQKLEGGPDRAAPELCFLKGADHNFVMPGCPERLAEALLAWLGAAERPWNRRASTREAPSVGSPPGAG